MKKRNVRLCTILAAALIVFAGCSSFPRPGSIGDSLLVVVGDLGNAANQPVRDVVVLNGPQRVSIDLAHSSDGVQQVRVRPGEYTLTSRTIWWKNGAHRTFNAYSGRQIAVRPSAVVLSPWKFPFLTPSNARPADSIAAVTPADRRRAATETGDYIGIAEWAGRNVIGFEPYSPFAGFMANTYTITFRSTPENARLTIDGEDWGTTPLPAQLTAGKHVYKLFVDGYSEKSGSLDVQRNGAEQIDLTRVQPGTAGPTSGRTAVLIESFSNLGSREYDNLSGALTSSLATALTQAGVVVARGTTPPGSDRRVSVDGPAEPDFAAAAEAGVEAFVAGDYVANDQTVLIHAALYDTQTGLVKASVLFDGKGGTDIFDTIDQMTARLSASVARALPAVGHDVVKERVVTPQSASFDTYVTQKEIIRKRDAHRFSVVAGPSLAGVADEIVDPSSPTNTTSRINGPGLGAFLGADYTLTGPISLHVATMPFYFQDRSGNSKVEIPAYIGTRYHFSGLKNDVYLGLQGAVHYAPAQSVIFNSSPSAITMGPFLLVGMNFEAGVNLYTNKRISQTPAFTGIGLTL
ncbi:MAG TPA: PEGA domain-containing protein, partial [Spirochaetia bacterium]|nr:PEGA domain-containing protein [Spirochaetia bacterium]